MITSSLRISKVYECCRTLKLVGSMKHLALFKTLGRSFLEGLQGPTVDLFRSATIPFSCQPFEPFVLSATGAKRVCLFSHGGSVHKESYVKAKLYSLSRKHFNFERRL